MEKEKIEYLALEATKAYMSGKTMASRDSFLEEFMETYDMAVVTINKREAEKKSNETKAFWEDLKPLDMEDDLDDDFSNSKQR